MPVGRPAFCVHLVYISTHFDLMLYVKRHTCLLNSLTSTYNCKSKILTVWAALSLFSSVIKALSPSGILFAQTLKEPWRDVMFSKSIYSIPSNTHQRVDFPVWGSSQHGEALMLCAWYEKEKDPSAKLTSHFQKIYNTYTKHIQQINTNIFEIYLRFIR